MLLTFDAPLVLLLISLLEDCLLAFVGFLPGFGEPMISIFHFFCLDFFLFWRRVEDPSPSVSSSEDLSQVFQVFLFDFHLPFSELRVGGGPVFLLFLFFFFLRLCLFLFRGRFVGWMASLNSEYAERGDTGILLGVVVPWGERSNRRLAAKEEEVLWNIICWDWEVVRWGADWRGEGTGLAGLRNWKW